MALVIDASVALTWCFASEATPETDEVLQEVLRTGATVPALWHVELANILSRAGRLGRIDAAGVDGFFSRLDCLSISTDAPAVEVQRTAVLRLVRRFGLTAYDAIYLELAQRLGGTLATLDEDLRAAAVGCGITCVP